MEKVFWAMGLPFRIAFAIVFTIVLGIFAMFDQGFAGLIRTLWRWTIDQSGCYPND